MTSLMCVQNNLNRPLGGTPIQGVTYTGGASEPFVNGSGTIGDPYLIEKGEHLLYLKELLAARNYPYASMSYKLTVNIDWNNYDWTDGLGKATDGGDVSFTGSFDGDNHYILNLNFARLYAPPTTGNSSGGFFTTLYGANVKNLTLKGITNSTTPETPATMGLLSYRIVNSAIENVFVEDATIDMNGSNAAYTGYTFGGFAGIADTTGSTYTNCGVRNVVATGINKPIYGGGFLGLVYADQTFTNCCGLNIAIFGLSGTLSGTFCALPHGYSLLLNQCLFEGNRHLVGFDSSPATVGTDLVFVPRDIAGNFADSPINSGDSFAVMSSPAVAFICSNSANNVVADSLLVAKTLAELGVLTTYNNRYSDSLWEMGAEFLQLKGFS